MLYPSLIKKKTKLFPGYKVWVILVAGQFLCKTIGNMFFLLPIDLAIKCVITDEQYANGCFLVSDLIGKKIIDKFWISYQ